MMQRRYREERVTLSDVARMAGVSPITVSRALRSPQKVSTGLRQSILRLVDEMGYVPDIAARELASRASDIIFVMLPALTNFVFMRLLQGVEDRVSQSGFRIQYANTRLDPAEDFNQFRLFLKQNPAGVITTEIEPASAIKELLRQAHYPVVEISDVATNPADMAIGFDYRAAGMAVARHMLSRGYQRFGFVAGRRDIRAMRCEEGYAAVMKQAGLFNPDLILYEDEATSASLGCRMLTRLRERDPMADGAFCQNDDIALGVVFECKRLGIRIPDDFGVCGFNDLDFAGLSEPAISSVHVPRYDIGYGAADMILRVLEGYRKQEDFVNVGFKLMERGSTQRSAA